jgi:hypothetical protein
VNEYALQVIQRHRQSGVLVDTNLLLLYLIGSFRREQITRFKRTNTFTIEDFDLLERLLGQFARVLTTPNILTEVSNLAGQLSSHLKPDFFSSFAARISFLDEHQVASSVVAPNREFVKFGLTDAVMIALAKESHLVLTAEFPLANYLQSLGMDVINFNHLRSWY